MVGLDRRGEAVDVRVPAALRLVQAAAPREHHVGALEQPRLGLLQARRRGGEVRQLVHAVVDDDLPRPQAIAVEGEHRRVEPADQRPAAPGHRHVVLDQPAQVVVPFRPPMGPEDGDPLGHGEHVEPGRPIVEHRLLLDDHRPRPRQPREQVLRALEDPIPSQVAVAEQDRDFLLFTR